MKHAFLVLSDGSAYRGSGFGAEASRAGELVFSTSMTGYQEALTDPSYAGQILLMAYPLIGNYGISRADSESAKIHAEGFAVRESCKEPQHALSEKTLDRFLEDNGVPGISGIDTRALVRKIRDKGVMPACLAAYSGKAPDAEELAEKAKSLDYSGIDFVKEVTCGRAETISPEKYDKKVVLLDCGAKGSIAKELVSKGVSVTIVPASTPANDILAYEPDGFVISNGPGNPALLSYAINTTRDLLGKLPIFGICLGNQILAHALGGTTYKLPFGHRGANQPVKDLRTGRVFITTQNHGFAVRDLPAGAEVTHRNCNDGTVEGLAHADLRAFSVQYHPEANPGPYDSRHLFNDFLGMIR